MAVLCGALGLPLGAGAATELDDETPARWSPSATRPGRPATAPRADAIRDELAARGWTVEDGPDGTTVRR